MTRRAPLRWARRMALAAIALAAGTVRPVPACDACLEDKIAATYDWNVVSAAERRHHTVVFAALRGPVTPGDPALARTVTRAVQGIAGVDAGTVRVASSPPAVSFACDPARAAPAALVRSINRSLGAGRSLVIVRVGAPRTPAPVASRTHP